jgi:deazaflavin-dependent oxidoreductase (nitroreductase family)
VANGPDEIGEELAAWGKVALIATRGRVTGNPTRTAVGFALEPDGKLLVAAGADDADWALNLRQFPECDVTIGGETRRYAAVELAGDERNRAITALILKYGTPAERLGAGPAFLLRTADV